MAIKDDNKTIYNPNEGIKYDSKGVTDVYVNRTVAEGRNFFNAAKAGSREASPEAQFAADSFVLATKECGGYVLGEYIRGNTQPWERFKEVYGKMDEKNQLLLHGVVKDARAVSRCVLDEGKNPWDVKPHTPYDYTIGPDVVKPAVKIDDWKRIYADTERMVAYNKFYTPEDVDKVGDVIQTIGSHVGAAGVIAKEPKASVVGAGMYLGGSAIKVINHGMGYIADKIYGNN